MQSREKQATSLLSLLAIQATNDARGLLKKYGMSDAKNINDLQDKLVDLYKSHPDKIEIEKEFVNIHPHKDFILKYNKPISLPIEPEMNEPEFKSSCEGCPGKCSSMDGNKESLKINNPASGNMPIIIVATTIVATVGLVGLFLHHAKNK